MKREPEKLIVSRKEKGKEKIFNLKSKILNNTC